MRTSALIVLAAVTASCSDSGRAGTDAEWDTYCATYIATEAAWSDAENAIEAQLLLGGSTTERVSQQGDALDDMADVVADRMADAPPSLIDDWAAVAALIGVPYTYGGDNPDPEDAADEINAAAEDECGVNGDVLRGGWFE